MSSGRSVLEVDPPLQIKQKSLLGVPLHFWILITEVIKLTTQNSHHRWLMLIVNLRESRIAWEMASGHAYGRLSYYLKVVRPAYYKRYYSLAGTLSCLNGEVKQHENIHCSVSKLWSQCEWLHLVSPA